MNQAIVWTPYCGVAPGPGELLSRWNFDPILIVAMVLAIYGGLRRTRGIPALQCRFVVAVALAMLLFLSPFCALTSALFSARAVHHLVLTAILAPLLAASLPSSREAGGLGTWLALHTATFWFWHLPSAYALALSYDAVYWLMQGSLLLTALAFWRSVRSAPVTIAIAGLLGAMVQMGLLGALLTFIAKPLYAPHAVSSLAWRLSPLEDQQIAGLIMWAPGAAIYLGAAVALAARWLGRERQQSLAA